jgi:hypothetical protein
MLSIVLVGTALGADPKPLFEPATSAVAGVGNLPSTSTVADITAGLIALGIAAAAMAFALVRRRSST